MCSERQWISMFVKWSIYQGGCSTKWNNCIPQDIDTSCRYDNDPRWFPQAMDVTESHHIVLITFSHLNRTTSTFVLKFSPLQVVQFNISTIGTRFVDPPFFKLFNSSLLWDVFIINSVEQLQTRGVARYMIDWLIDWCLTSSEQLFSYIQDENI